VRQERPGFPGWLLDMVDRFKFSRAGVDAHEVLVIDRSDPDKTVKTHRVEELLDGQWETRHQHREEWPAKTKRPHLQETP